MKTLNDYITEKFQVSKEIIDNKYSDNYADNTHIDIIEVLLDRITCTPSTMVEIENICTKFNNYNYENLAAECINKYEDEGYAKKNLLRLQLPKYYSRRDIVKKLIRQYGNIIIYDKQTKTPEFFIFLTGTKDVNNPNIYSSHVFSDMSVADDNLYYVFVANSNKNDYKIYTKTDIIDILDEQ